MYPNKTYYTDQRQNGGTWKVECGGTQVESTLLPIHSLLARNLFPAPAHDSIDRV